MNDKKPTLPAVAKQSDKLDNVESAALDHVVGGCACGDAMPNCKIQMGTRRFGWR